MLSDWLGLTDTDTERRRELAARIDASYALLERRAEARLKEIRFPETAEEQASAGICPRCWAEMRGETA